MVGLSTVCFGCWSIGMMRLPCEPGLGCSEGFVPRQSLGIREYCREAELKPVGSTAGPRGRSLPSCQVARSLKSHSLRLDALLEQLQRLATFQRSAGQTAGVERKSDGTSALKFDSSLKPLIQDEGIQTPDDLVRVLQTYDIQAETQLQANAVRVMTMHKAKGLSSELVIIPGSGARPNSWTIRGRAGSADDVCCDDSRPAHPDLTHALTRTGTQSYLVLAVVRIDVNAPNSWTRWASVASMDKASSKPWHKTCHFCGETDTECQYGSPQRTDQGSAV